jgi:hypothetical protein
MTLLLIKAKKKNKQFNLKPKKRCHYTNSTHHSSLSSISTSTSLLHYTKKKESI